MKSILWGLIICITPIVGIYAQKKDLPITLYEKNAADYEKNTIRYPRNAIALLASFIKPQGDYANIGYANAGWGLNLDLQLKLHKNWCAGMFIKAFSNPLARYAQSDPIIKQLLPIYPNSTLVYNPNYQPQNENWQHLLAAFDTGLSFIEKKITFDVRFLGGILFTAQHKPPSINGNYQNQQQNTEQFSYLQTRTSSTSPAWGFSMALSYPIARHLALMAKFEYINAYVKTNKSINLYSPSYQLQSTNAQQLAMQLICLNAGIKYQFGRIKQTER